MNPYFKLPPLHEWQVEALAKLTVSISLGKKDFLAVISVGGGKTRFALESAVAMLASGKITRVIVITNTTRLIKQWARTATRLGLNLHAAFGNKDLKEGLPPDAVGYICSYASMGNWPDLHEAYAGGARTLVIFDEIHHLADDDRDDPNPQVKSVWGDKAKMAFKDVEFRLALSGTPFRTRGERLPFVTYDWAEDEPTELECVADHTYRYGEAVTNEICRPVVFKSYDAQADWEQKIVFIESGAQFNVTFADELADPVSRNARLWASTNISVNDEVPKDLAKSRWQLLVNMLRDADRKLQDLRATDHPEAGGIIICSNADAAKAVQRLLKRITKSNAILVLYEDAKSDDAIDAFAEGTTPWIISVRKVSEGVDIPRLRVCVYATHVTALVHFMQVLGRIVRYPSLHPAEPWGEAYFYFPADGRLVEYATNIEDELKQYLARKKDGPGGGGGGVPEREAIHAAGNESANIASGGSFDHDVVELADVARRDLGLERVSLVELMRFWQRMHEGPQAREANDMGFSSYSEEREELRTKAQDLVGKLNYLTDRPFDRLHQQANDAVGIRKTATATIDQLKRKVAWLREQIVAANGNSGNNFDDEGE